MATYGTGVMGHGSLYQWVMGCRCDECTKFVVDNVDDLSRLADSLTPKILDDIAEVERGVLYRLMYQELAVRYIAWEAHDLICLLRPIQRGWVGTVCVPDTHELACKNIFTEHRELVRALEKHPCVNGFIDIGMGAFGWGYEISIGLCKQRRAESIVNCLARMIRSLDTTDGGD